jgi:hypothetical protein
MYNVGLYGSQFAQPMNNMYVWAWCIDKHIEYGMHAYKYRLISLYICLIWCTGFSRCIEPAKEKNWNHLEPYPFNFSSFFFLSFSSRWETAVTYCGVPTNVHACQVVGIFILSFPVAQCSLLTLPLWSQNNPANIGLLEGKDSRRTRVTSLGLTNDKQENENLPFKSPEPSWLTQIGALHVGDIPLSWFR